MAHNTGVKRDIPIKLGDFSVIDSEFSNIRERFDAEMRKMEDEMTKFRSDLMNRESNFFKTTSKLVYIRLLYYIPDTYLQLIIIIIIALTTYKYRIPYRILH